ncbi:hypothetical protein PVAP13_9NG762977 [Panicum virgatum]|uniref:F-box domain-containing protein n=1 Tax=Panicum virgatum TaxID=38727 RepID=A0A8T0N3E9_PANVG|nr:hypothetical protein PVAP13_9NG762977 [Panicum virgatum]
MDNGDVLAAVLQRLAPRSLAVSRCVCRAWRATIDARRMLRGDLLPVSLGGIFVSLGHEPAPPEFFARPSTVLVTSLDQHNRIHFDMVEEQSTKTREVVSEDRAIFSD